MSAGLLSREQTAEQLGVGLSTVKRLIAAGDLPTVKIGRRTLIDPRDLRALVDRHRSDAPPAEPDVPSHRMIAALAARSDQLDRRTGEPRGTWKRAIVLRASRQFEREIPVSWGELTYEEASWALDQLGDELANAKGGA